MSLWPGKVMPRVMKRSLKKNIEPYNLSRFDEEVRRSQVRRWIVYEALRNGEYYPWDYQPIKKASERFMRNHMDLNIVEERRRFPRRK